MVQVEFVHNKLVGRIIEKFGSKQAFSKATGSSMVLVSRKLNNKTRISRDDIIMWCSLLEIEPKEIPIYFFDQKV